MADRVSLADLEKAAGEVQESRDRLVQLVARALAEQEVPITKVCRAVQITRQTAYRWHREQGG